jgi:hypothetical protein
MLIQSHHAVVPCRGATRCVASVLSVALMTAGCATSSKDITATYVSPLQYQSFDCQQLQMESQRIQGRVVELGGRLDQAASNDKALVGVGMILFWPALFALGGTKQQEAEYGRLRGEYDAVQQTSVQKKCLVATAPSTPAATTASTPATAPATTPATTPAAAPAAASAPST